MVDPRIMCRQHLLGEHVEIHMFAGIIDRGYSVKGYLEQGLLEVHNLYERHEELVREMKRRNYRHDSEIDKKWKPNEENRKHYEKLYQFSYELYTILNDNELYKKLNVLM